MIVLKTGVTKDGQPWQRVRILGYDAAGAQTDQKVRFFGSEIGFTEWQMLKLGNYAVQTIKDRVAQGIGSDDAPMPPLKGSRQRRRWSKSQQRWVEYGAPGDSKWNTGYRKQKADAGLPPIRNLSFSGDMLKDFSVRSVSAREVRMDITTSTSRMKARVNEIRAPWFGWSTQDVLKIYAMARQLFGDIVRDVGLTVGGRSGKVVGSGAGEWSTANVTSWRTSQPIWMNPWAHQKTSDKQRESTEQLRVRISSGSVRPRRKAA